VQGYDTGALESDRRPYKPSLLSPKDRWKFLSEVCTGDEALRSELSSLLNCDVPDTPLIKVPLPSASSALDPTARDLEGHEIGRYRILARLGAGSVRRFVFPGMSQDKNTHTNGMILLGPNSGR